MLKIHSLGFYKLSSIILLNVLYVYAFYTMFGLDKTSQTISVLHAIMAGILISQLNNLLLEKGRLSLGYLLSYVLCMYFQFSIVKYCRIGTFYGFSKDNMIRFQGTIIIFLVLFFVNKIQFFVKDNRSIDGLDIRNRPIGCRLWVWVITIFLFLYYVVIYNYSNSIYVSYNYKTQSILIIIALNIAVSVGIYLSIFYLESSRPITYIPLIIEVIIFSYYSLRTGSRANFFAYTLLVLFMLTEKKILKLRWFTIAQVFAPWFMIFFTYFSFSISGRYTVDLSKVVAMNIAYRFDLSDLAINILNGTSWIRFNISEIGAGLQNCIPSFISTRYKGFLAYQQILIEAKLNPSVDYSDTFFSMGATIGGVAGMVFIIPIFYLIYELIDMKLNKCGNKGVLIKLLCILSLTRIEIEWTSFIPELRNMVISIFAIIIAYKAISVKYSWGGKRI